MISRPKALALLLLLPCAVGVSEFAAWKWMNPHSGKTTVKVPEYTGAAPNKTRETNEKVIDLLSTKDIYTSDFHVTPKQFIRFYDMQWNGRDNFHLSLFFSHRPEICFESLGSKLQSIHGQESLSLGDYELIFDVTEFHDAEGRTFYVFKAPWAEGIKALNLRGRFSALALQGVDHSQRFYKLNMIMLRSKPRYGRTYMCTAFGFPSKDAAWQATRDRILKDITLVEIPVK